MKQYNNNPPVRFEKLNRDQKDKAIEKMADIIDVHAHTMKELMQQGYVPDKCFRFFVTSEISVGVQERL